MTKRHDAPANRKSREPLYDTEVPTPSHAERARTLAEDVGTATLCTVSKEPSGHPYGSFVAYSMDGPTPIFLVSKLAEHTRNMLQDERVSLLIAEPGTGDPLARGRVTLLGTCAELTGDAAVSARESYRASIRHMEKRGDQVTCEQVVLAEACGCRTRCI